LYRPEKKKMKKKRKSDQICSTMEDDEGKEKRACFSLPSAGWLAGYIELECVNHRPL
jgi:hypothetical protein